MQVDSGVGGGLTLHFQSDPTAPATIGGTFAVQVATLKLELKDVRAVGDAAPGDARTSISELEVSWPGTDPSVLFGAAPPGMYSFVLGRVHEYHVTGSVVVDSESHLFDIKEEDFPDIDLSIPVVGFVLAAGEAKTLDVHLDLAGFLLDVAWGDQNPDLDGVIRIDGTTSFINDVRDGLRQAFGTGDAGS